MIIFLENEILVFDTHGGIVRLTSKSRVAEPESEVFGWSRSRIPNNTGSRSRIFLSDSDSGCPIESFFTPHS